MKSSSKPLKVKSYQLQCSFIKCFMLLDPVFVENYLNCSQFEDSLAPGSQDSLTCPSIKWKVLEMENWNVRRLAQRNQSGNHFRCTYVEQGVNSNLLRYQHQKSAKYILLLTELPWHTSPYYLGATLYSLSYIPSKGLVGTT